MQFTAGQEDHITALGEALEPAREVLHRHKWLAGASPGYPDICLFALFTVRCSLLPNLEHTSCLSLENLPYCGLLHTLACSFALACHLL